MDVTKRVELEKAYRKEKDSRVILRMLAVHMVRVRKMSVSGTATNLMRSDRWVHTWLERFDAGGLDDLRDLTRSSRSMQIRSWWHVHQTEHRTPGKRFQNNAQPSQKPWRCASRVVMGPRSCVCGLYCHSFAVTSCACSRHRRISSKLGLVRFIRLSVSFVKNHL